MNYSYKVTRVDAEAKCMDVEFSSDGQPTISVGVRLPVQGENIDDVIKSFAPTFAWSEHTAVYATVTEGLSGSYIEPTQLEISQSIENQKMWEQTAFEQQVAKVLVKFGVLSSDPTEIESTIL